MNKVTIFIVVLILFVLVGCSQSYGKQNLDLEESIYSIVEDKNNSDIHLTSLTDFDWDKAFLFEPYSTQKSINEQLGIDYEDPSKIGIRDDIYLLIFLNEGKVVHYAEINRQQCSFYIEENDYLTPTNDLLYIERY